MELDFISSLAIEAESKVVLVVMDGVGGIGGPQGKTALEAAHTPVLDALAKASVCGFHDPVSTGITPGSGPAHIGLFGYDPFRYNIGRGVLDTAGTDFKFQKGDLAARLNFATLAKDGTLADRRAGRLSDREGKRVVEKLAGHLDSVNGVELLLQHVKEYRAAAVFRGEKLDGRLCDSDPQKTGKAPIPVAPTETEPRPEAIRAAQLANSFVSSATSLLADERAANFLLMRGFDVYDPLPDFNRLYSWRATAIAAYPMYKGVAKLAGMRVVEASQVTVEDEVSLLEKELPNSDFIFLHVKKTDSKGEDGDFEGKVDVIEHFDTLLERVIDCQPDVLCITGDHCTPCSMAGHSWHPVPLCINAKTARVDRCEHFGESDFLSGGLGRVHSTDVLPLLLAHAGRLAKFGA
jgi:2,3-bisphosphoglycerate-independent phosphoglycerate mutase